MSSSEVQSTQGFVPDVDGAGDHEFQPEAVAVAKQLPVDEGPVDLDEYRPGPSEDEIRAECRAKMEQELADTLLRRRQEDATEFQVFVAEMKQASAKRHEELSRRAAELALLVAQRLVRAHIEADPTVIERVLADATKAIGHAQGLVVHAHPDDAEYLRAHADSLPELGVAEVKDDPHQQRGGCFVDDGSNGWDLTFVSQLARVQEAIDAAVRGS